MSIEVRTGYRSLLPFLLLLCLLGSSYTSFAQQRKKKPQPDTLHLAVIDSATLSKRITQLAKDSSIRKSDTAVAVIINRIEGYTLLLNQVMSTLRRGFDTAWISDEIPLVDTSLTLIKYNIAGLGGTPNINDIYTNKVMLDQLQRRLTSWQTSLFSYYDKLVSINDTIHSLQRDTSMRNIPAEDELYGFYIGQLTNLIIKFRAADSANRINLIKMGLLQNKVANRYIEVSNLREDMDYRLNQFSSHMFNRDYRYIWRPHRDSINPLEFIPVMRNSLHKSTKVLTIFFSIQWPIFIVWLLLAGLFAWWIYYNIQRVRQRHPAPEAEAILQHSRYVYRFPVACTIIFVTTLSSVLSVRYPILYTEITWALTMTALTYIFRTHLPTALFRYWLMLVGLLIVYSLNNLLIEVTYAEQWGLLISAALAILLGNRLLKETTLTTFAQPRFTRPIIKLFMLTSSFSLLLVILARVSSAKIIGSAAVVNTVMALNLSILVKILMEAVYLQVEANKNSSSFISFLDYQEVQKKLKTLLTVLATVGWLVIIARNLYLYDAIYEWISEFLSTTHKIGNSEFTFSSVIIFVLVIWIAFFASQLIAYMFGNTGTTTPVKKTKFGSALLLLRLAVLAGGILLAFAASGIPMDKLTIVIGALGVGIGFGLQNVVNNLVSGIILAFEKPIEVGDVIEVGNRSGVVKEIGIRSSKIAAYDGSQVIVPNGDLISQQLINWTLNNRTRRVDFTIGVAYGSNIEQVFTILKSAFTDHEGILTVPEPLVQLTQFSDNAVTFRVFFWISDLGTAGTLQSEVLAHIYNEFNKAGIELPYPQRDLHIRSIDETLLKKWDKPATD
ncbi:mechanosensitive ion channel family protein [Chitinophaga nivalis]|uniref:Mechanosensitive ion channel n=1 Tax=Chitinophaga nivalis TaxID=2991709 RepID=A0ABT3IFE9_9BACT|nr:mechanosensitive ion channel domain-containing protein [Chitinophaga nivalis]MCW3467809.1 mechanosensitive ion channel [Chitinophaga nivalis]MCW3482499.1 mechanosensitive ion channel [Chitinophaga nivalis]